MTKILQAMRLNLAGRFLREYKIKTFSESHHTMLNVVMHEDHIFIHRASTNTKHDVLTWAGRHTGTGKVSVVAHFEVGVDGVVIG